MFSIMLYRI